jgi:hypothetical protein
MQTQNNTMLSEHFQNFIVNYISKNRSNLKLLAFFTRICKTLHHFTKGAGLAVWANITSVAPPLSIELPVPSQISERSCWVQPWLFAERRLQFGHYDRSMEDQQSFFNFLRMPPTFFNLILYYLLWIFFTLLLKMFKQIYIYIYVYMYICVYMYENAFLCV